MRAQVWFAAPLLAFVVACGKLRGGGPASPPAPKTAAAAPAAAPAAAAPAAPAAAAAAPVAAPAPAAHPAAPAVAPVMVAVLDSAAMRPGRFDGGKMWTFDHPPLDWFQEAYGFRPDSAWLERARLGAMRFATYCSSSIVSPHGLILTNHHCSRENTGSVMRKGENLDSTGFFAATQKDERKVPDLFVEQLVSIADVTGQIDSAVQGVTGDQALAQARDQAVDGLEQELTAAAGDSTLRVQVVSLYQGAVYSAYTYRRYNDVRLVFLPELQMGYFGGDEDNFTYPRYDLDFSLYRVYDDKGQPLATPNYFKFSKTGAAEGDAVFVVGNPATTSRLETVAQLAYERDVRIPTIIEILKSRIHALETFQEKEPAIAAERHMGTQIFGYANSLKSYQGQLDGLRNPVLFGRRVLGERAFRSELERRPDLAPRAALLDSIAAVEAEGTAIGPRVYAFLANPDLGSATLGRAGMLSRYARGKQAGAPEPQLARFAQQIAAIGDKPPALERQLVAAQYDDLVRALGPKDTLVVAILAGRTPDSAAADLLAHTALNDSARAAAILAGDPATWNDPAIVYVRRVSAAVGASIDRARGLSARAENLAADLARVRFDVYGQTRPPDASFTLRLADGKIASYPYNGTRAPAFTTFYGMYERYTATGGKAPWNLPPRWQKPPVGLSLATPLDLVSTNDISGGNSGSPLLNRNLEVVGLIFDSNMEGLAGEYMYTDATARAVSVDVRAILASLRAPYKATRLADELEGKEPAKPAAKPAPKPAAKPAPKPAAAKPPAGKPAPATP
ncbi:MAG TPA: S46 family peptidase [Gemmatimonadales bacterium]|nr:S46 family peptidase [Gemmatimonadales bacterium]